MTDLLNDLSVVKASRTIRAVNHKLRLKLIDFIGTHESVNVQTIYKKLRIEQSVASAHLAILRMSNVVVDVKKGQQVFYSINYSRLSQIKKAVKHINFV